MNKHKARLLLVAAVVAGSAAAVIPGAVPASASGATVTQVSALTLNSADPTVIDVGTINSQFSSITVDASGQTTWCNDNPSPACISNPTGSLNYSFTLGPNATAPGFTVGTFIGKIGLNGTWFAIGTHFVATSPVVADLYVAYDDDVFFDNSGSYSLTITRLKPAT